MRTLIIVSFLFFAVVPMASAADSSCNYDGSAGNQCIQSGVSGVCDVAGICQSGQASPGGGSALSPDVALINPLGGSCSGGNCLMNFLQSILQFVVTIGTVVIVLMVVFVGYKFVVAQGAPAKIEEARTMLLWTVIGALILLGAQAIASAIQATVTAIGG